MLGDEPTVAPPPAPSLAPLLPAGETARLNREIDARIARSRRNIEILEGRELTAPQLLQRDRIVAFIGQALAMRRSDLAAADNLARRAAVLSQELVENTAK